jgi:putative SOS response-associated peptidase YedK
MKSGKPFAFAGLWEKWKAPDGSEVRSCTIVTGKPNALVRDIHDRMPVIIPGDLYKSWLDPAEVPADAVEAMLAPYPADEMVAHPVSRAVNNPKTDAPSCIESVTADEAAPSPDDSRAKRSKREKQQEPAEDQLF